MAFCYPPLTSCARVILPKLILDRSGIELFFLPPYSPELNPDEYVNRALKTEIRSRAPAKIESLKARTLRFMAKMDRSTRHILKIFEIEEVRYAASVC